MEFEKIRDIIAEKMDIEASEITEDASFESLQVDMRAGFCSLILR